VAAKGRVALIAHSPAGFRKKLVDVFSGFIFRRGHSLNRPLVGVVQREVSAILRDMAGKKQVT
jgi:hypothetical protein